MTQEHTRDRRCRYRPRGADPTAAAPPAPAAPSAPVAPPAPAAPAHVVPAPVEPVPVAPDGPPPGLVPPAPVAQPGDAAQLGPEEVADQDDADREGITEHNKIHPGH
eukprot:9336538-Lingulodinium_polyedra.AAC.1